MVDEPEIRAGGTLLAPDIHSLSGENTYGGITSFLRRPITITLSRIDAVVIGAPLNMQLPTALAPKCRTLSVLV